MVNHTRHEHHYTVKPPHRELFPPTVRGITLYVGNKLQVCMCNDNIKARGITLYVGNKLQVCMCKDNIKVRGITLYV
jgi:hypothetical protein